MTNKQYIIQNITDEHIVEIIRKLYCELSLCSECPIRENCNDIFDILEQNHGIAPDGNDVILYWLNHGNDYVFYSHKPNNKYKPQDLKESQYNFRNRCNICGKHVNSYGLANLSIGGTSMQNNRVIGKVCEKCFDKVCKLLKIEKPNFTEPCFDLCRTIPKKHKISHKTYCANCGKSSSPRYRYCPHCGERLDF